MFENHPKKKIQIRSALEETFFVIFKHCDWYAERKDPEGEDNPILMSYKSSLDGHLKWVIRQHHSILKSPLNVSERRRPICSQKEIRSCHDISKPYCQHLSSFYTTTNCFSLFRGRILLHQLLRPIFFYLPTTAVSKSLKSLVLQHCERSKLRGFDRERESRTVLQV